MRQPAAQVIGHAHVVVQVVLVAQALDVAGEEGVAEGRLRLRPLASIRGADIAALRDEWLQDYAPATVLRRLAVLSHVFNVARKEWGMFGAPGCVTCSIFCIYTVTALFKDIKPRD